MLKENWEKVKYWLREGKNDLFVAALIFLIGLIGFGLGRLSILVPKKEPLRIEDSTLRAPKASGNILKKAASIISSEESQSMGRETAYPGKYVASKSGSAYHTPECPGAQKIKEENKIWFQTKEEAEATGYRPAGNCDGL